MKIRLLRYLVLASSILLFFANQSTQGQDLTSFALTGSTTNNNMGSSVIIDGDYAAVYGNSDIKIHFWNGSGWTVAQTITHGNFASVSQALALHNGYLVIGEASVNNIRGQVRIMKRNSSGTYILHKTLISDVNRDNLSFGFSVAMAGDILIVGAPSSPGSTNINTRYGEVFLYEKNRGGSDNWGLIRKLPIPDSITKRDHGPLGGGFGSSVAVNGLVAAAGYPAVGSVVTFQPEVSTWEPVYFLSYPLGVQDDPDLFGYSIAIKDFQVAVGVPRSRLNAGSTADRPGAVYYYGVVDGLLDHSNPVLIRHDNPANGDNLGRSVAFHNEFLLSGAQGLSGVNTGTGGVVIFNKSGSNWQETHRLTRNIPQNSGFGYSLSVDKTGNMIVGAPFSNTGGTNGGGAFIYILVPKTPSFLNADNGAATSIINLNWQEVTGEKGYRVYSNGTSLTTTNENTSSFSHMNLNPGVFNHYEVAAYTDFGESKRISATGHTFANGGISGSVKTINNVGVPGVFVYADPYLSNAATLNGNGYIEIPHTSSLNQTDNFTIESWIYVEEFNDRYGIYSTRRNNEAGSFQFETLTGGRLGVSSINTFLIISPNNVISHKSWNHVAYVRSGNMHRLYVNGTQVAQQEFDFQYLANQSPKMIGAGTFLSQFLNGSIDEVRIWNEARTQQQIASGRNIRLNGNEPNLAAYWPILRVFQGEAAPYRDFIADFKSNGGSHGQGINISWISTGTPVRQGAFTNGQGDYSISRINYLKDDKYKVTPVLAGHGFDPAFREVTLGAGFIQSSNVNFTDTTSFTVSGRISFNNTVCYLGEVEILVNGNPTLVKTDSEGYYSVPIMTPGTVVIRPSYKDHTFSPVSTTLQVFGDYTGIDFKNTQTHTLSGKVVGGDCNLNIGGAAVSVSGPGNCYSGTVNTNAQSSYSVVVPAISSLGIAVNPVNNLIQFNPRQASLRDSSMVVDFIYRTRPEIALMGLPAPVGSCNAMVLEQQRIYGVELDVFERYGIATCPVDVGEVRFFNQVADRTVPDTVQIDGGKATYVFMAGKPNIVGGGSRPYQKQIQIEVITGDKAGSFSFSETFENWFIVEGNRPREQTFATVTPELPLFILRDPPGDSSYSFLTNELSLCTTNSFSLLGGGGGTKWAAAKLGFGFESGWGITTETKVWGEITGSVTTNITSISQEEVKTCLVTSDTFQTSDSESVIGSGGDIYIGAAQNIIYALTDILTYNTATCRVELSSNVIFGEDGFATQYIYTEDFIENNLIPRLVQLRDLPSTPADSVIYLDDQVNIWHQTLKINRDIKENLKNVDADANYSFDGSSGAFTQQTTTTSSKTGVIEFNIEMDYQLAVEVGFEVAGSGVKGGLILRGRHHHGSSTTTDSTVTSTVGFVLNDSDPGDFFSVNVKHDETFGTPVFELVAGTTSCPWEPGSQAREGVNLTSNTLVQNDVPAGQSATFRLTLGNTSESDETMSYRLAAVPGSNPDGAVILINGIPISTLEPYTIPAGQSLDQTMTVSKGPVAFDYEDLQIVLRSLCDSQIADTLSVTARFETTCSPITLLQPESSWLVNSASDNKLLVSIRDYDKSLMANIKLEYAGSGSNNWVTSQLISVDDLPANQTLLNWNVESIPDGAYDFRISLQCNAGIVQTPRVSGVIDRTPPKIVGLPAPSSGILGLGDVISVTFNEKIIPESVNNTTVKLIDLGTGTAIPHSITLSDKSIVITPEADNKLINNRLLQASVSSIRDIYGNMMPEAKTWVLRVRNNPLSWEVPMITNNLFENEIKPFSAKLVNQGPVSETFQIIKQPDWANLSAQSGEILPGGEYRITLTPNSVLNTGAYRDTLIARTTRGDESLTISMNIQCMPPSWELNAAAFSESMTVTAGYYIQNLPFSGENDIAAAFVNNELRGLATVVPIVPTGGASGGYEYAAFLTIYSNQTSGETVQFRLWDVSECRVMDITDAIPFVANASAGSATQPLTLGITGAVLQSIDLADGTTWMSLGVEATDMKVNTVMNRMLPGEGDLIRGQTGYSQFVAGAGWIGNLDELKPGVTYKASLGTGKKLEFIGNRVNSQEKPLVIASGWNWLGFLPEQSMPLNTALASLDLATGDIMRSQTAFSEYQNGNWVGNLNTLVPGGGYKMRKSDSDILIYPGTAGDPMELIDNVHGEIAGDSPDWSINVSDFETLMSVTGVAIIDGLPAAGADYLISAWAGNELRGVTAPILAMDRWMFFLNIYGGLESGEITFKLYDGINNSVLNPPGTLPFAADKITGSPRNPYQWNSSVSTDLAVDNGDIPVEFALGQNYPNPFNPTTRIRYALPEDATVRLVVYNMLGQRVAVLLNGHVSAGNHIVEFDATRLASGVYFYRIEAGGFIQTRKMLFMK